MHIYIYIYIYIYTYIYISICVCTHVYSTYKRVLNTVHSRTLDTASVNANAGLRFIYAGKIWAASRYTETKVDKGIRETG